MKAFLSPVSNAAVVARALVLALPLTLALALALPALPAVPELPGAAAQAASEGAEPDRAVSGAAEPAPDVSGPEESGAATSSTTSEPAQPAQPARPVLLAFDRVWQAVRDEYIDPNYGGLDWQAVREEYRPRLEAAGDDEAAYRLLVEMVERLGDARTFVVPPWERSQEPPPRGDPELEYAGIGVVIQQLESGDVVVVHVFDGSPAQRAGVLVGDGIVAVDGWQPAEGEGLEQVSQRIRGPVGTTVRLTLRDPEGRERSLEVTRARIDLRPVVEHRRLGAGAGYLRIPILSAQMADDASRRLPDLLSTPGLVLDLRGVQAGDVKGLTRVAQWFLGAASLGGFRTRQGLFPFPVVAEAIAAYQQPLVILTDPGTAGTAEILAFLLHEYGRATLVGQPTQGSLHLSRSLELPGGGLLQLATGEYLSPKGRPLPASGVAPDLEVPLPELADLRAGRDPALEAAVAALQQPPR